MQDFDEVITAARLGQAWALTAIFRAYAGPVAGYVRSRSPAEPDDLVSEVFTAAFTSLGRFSGDEGQFRSWLFTIAARRVVDDLRKRGRQVPTLPQDAYEDLRVVPSAEADALVVLQEQWVRQVLDRLVPAQREVLLLRVLADLTVEQVAARLGKSVGAVKQLQRRGLAAAAKVLDEQAPPRTPQAPPERWTQ